MTESQFLRTVEGTLAEVEAAVEASGIDAECAQTALILTIELDDGARIVINAQAPMRQLWLASRSGAMHFAYTDGRWTDTRSGAEFFDALARTLSEHLGTDVRLKST